MITHIYLVHFILQLMIIIANPVCPRETDNTFWQIAWGATNAGDTAIQSCPGSTEYYGKI